MDIAEWRFEARELPSLGFDHHTIAHFMTQISHESDGGIIAEEDFNGRHCRSS